YAGLAASTDGSFLAVWADARRGNQEIYSARVQVTVGPRPVPAPETRTLNDAVEVIADEPAHDEALGVTTIQVRRRNRSDRPIYPPLMLGVKHVVVGSKSLAANADRPTDAAGAGWDFSAQLGRQNRLDPGMLSEPKVLRLRSSVQLGL